MAKIKAICISEKKGVKKHEIPQATLKINHGILGDAHAGNWHRQISLLAEESVETMRQSGLELDPGDFAENILTKDIELKTLPIGTRLSLGDAEIEVTQIGKECHTACEIKKLVGKCVMPTEGIFAKVIKEGTIKTGDPIVVKSK